MPSTSARKDYPFSMRLPESDLNLIDRAALVQGRSRTEFIRNAALQAAETVLLEKHLIRMSPEGFAEFMEILSAPAAPVPALQKLASRSAPWESDPPASE